MSITSLSAISNLPIYALGTTTTLDSLINGNDLKIEISKGNSSSDTSNTYTSYKLDLNWLIKIIKSYIDSQINNLNTTLTAVDKSLMDRNTQQDTAISNKAHINHTHEYLPLSGGTLTGNLQTNVNNFYIQNNSDNKKITIQSGSNSQSSIILNNNNKGGFNIQCKNGDKNIKLEGTAEGDLKWNNKSLIQDGITIVDKYKNDDTWYRIHSDGWIEQGGVTGIYAPNNNEDIRINFLQKYNNVPNVIASIENTKGAFGNECTCVIGKYNNSEDNQFNSIDTAGFYVFVLRMFGSGPEGGRVHWYACGY